MQQAPDFSLPDQTGSVRSLKDFAGKWLVLYFYPKDDTPGCTTEACSFRDGRDVLQEMGAEVIGVSGDSVKSHAKFAKKYNLDFTLLADEDHAIVKAYGSWAPKKLFGHEFIGIHRDTYLINPRGEIVRKYQGVDPKTRVGEIMRDLQAAKETYR